jgi:hypothetical protein
MRRPENDKATVPAWADALHQCPGCRRVFKAIAQPRGHWPWCEACDWRRTQIEAAHGQPNHK